MGREPFSQPVFLKLHRSGDYQARNAREACEYLDLHWPGAKTAHYRQAKALCQAAIDGLMDTEAARRAVIDAAGRAGVLGATSPVDAAASRSTHVAVFDARRASDDEGDVNDADLVPFSAPREIVDDPSLSTSRKKALLAHWASDLHAVSGAPALRSVGGVTTTIDDLFRAMSFLDRQIDHAAMARTTGQAGHAW